MEKLGELDGLKITVLAEDSVLYGSPYVGQHGISLLLEAASSGNIRRILVDVGQNPETLISNMINMGICPSIVDAIVLTHCHSDHSRGIVRVLREIGRANIPVIAHPGIFHLHFRTEPYYMPIGIAPADSKEEIEKAGGSLSLTKDPFVVMPGMVTTGEVKRQTKFEEAGTTTLKTIENGMVVDDKVLDDISVIACIKDKGLVIVTGCSHAGIINITKQAMAITDCNKVEGIIGGLHLVKAPDARIKRTVEELTNLNVAWISVGHCTGFKAQVELYLAFAERFSPLHTGMQFDLVSDDRMLFL